MALAFVFPGQGSQRVGMGSSLAGAFTAARQTFEEVDDALHDNLSRTIFDGPESDLTMTENAQPALLAVSQAVRRVIETEGGIGLASVSVFVAGHSLGEYSAIAAAGGLSLADAVRLVRRRGRAMQDAVPVGDGAMAAILGLDIDAVTEIASAAAGANVCAVANDNAPGQVVISGAAPAIDRAILLAKERGARRCVPLAVSAPFHCQLMTPAAEVMAEALAEIELLDPTPALVANVTAEPVEKAADIRRLLVEQITGRVRWRESVMAMKLAGVDKLVELGAGKVLTQMTRRIDPELKGVSVETPEDVEGLLKTL